MSNSVRAMVCAAHQAPLSMGFSRQEYWIGLPFPSPADLPHPGMEPACPHFRQIMVWAAREALLFPSSTNQYSSSIRAIINLKRILTLTSPDFCLSFLSPACMCAKSLKLCPILCEPKESSLPGSSVHGVSPGKNTGVSCHALLQGIFLTQRSNHVSCWSCTAGDSLLLSPWG